MNTIFCNITYMIKYCGITTDDMVSSYGGAWVKKNKNAGERNNFLDYNGKCFGFVQNNGLQLHIERLAGVRESDDKAEDITIIWCAKREPSGSNVIVGWYNHATLYRQCTQKNVLPDVGIEGYYYMEAAAKDCYLLPEDQRSFVIPRAKDKGIGNGMGQANIWYAESPFAQKEFIPTVLEYIEEYDGPIINIVYNDAVLSECAIIDTNTNEEYNAFFESGRDYLEQERYYNALKVFNAAKKATDDPDAWFDAALALRGLYQYNSAIENFEKCVELEGESWDNLSPLPYLYSGVQRYEDAILVTNKLLETDEGKELDAKCELYSVLADSNYNLGKIDEGIKWLDKVISESKDKELIAFTRNTREEWLSLK